jgi:hypothetical protein
MADESLLAKIGKIPRRIVYLLILLAIVVPLFIPLNLPIAITKDVRLFADDLAALEGTGKTVLLTGMAPPPFWGEQRHIMHAVFQYLFLLDGVKFVVMPRGPPDTVGLYHQTLDKTINPLNKQYGVDWVMTQWIPGGSALLVQMAERFRETYTIDDQGTPIDELPIFDGISTLDDFELILWVDPIKGAGLAAQVLYPRFPHKTYYLICNGEGFVFGAAFVGPGLPYKAALVGPKPAAELQQIYGGPYTDVVQQMDAVSTYNILAMVLIILGNLAVISEKLRKTGVT